MASSSATANGSALTGFAAASAAAEQFDSAPSTAAMATQTSQEAAFAQYFSSMQTSSMAAGAGTAALAGGGAAYAVSGGSGTMHRAVQVRHAQTMAVTMETSETMVAVGGFHGYRAKRWEQRAWQQVST